MVLDVGTNNPERLADPEYLGWRHERVTGQAYFDRSSVRCGRSAGAARRLPAMGRFRHLHARPILERYRDRLLTFNDDIQGTAGVALAAILPPFN